MIRNTYDTIDTNDTLKGNISIISIINNKYHSSSLLDFFKAKGNKEGIIYYLYNRPKTYQQIDEELNLPLFFILFTLLNSYSCFGVRGINSILFKQSLIKENINKV